MGKKMDSGHGKKRRKMSDNYIETSVEVDRLSMLPNDLIHKILSFISTKETVRTIAWSSRYRFIWTTMPFLNFSTNDFPKFVTHFLTCRNSQVDLFSLKLRFLGKVTQPSVLQLMEYAFSHNVQQLDVECFIQKNDFEFPLSVFSSGAHSLKHLSLKEGWNKYYGVKVTSTLELPSLTTLYLRGVSFSSNDHTDNCAGLFSKCANLKNLTLKSCKIEGLSIFSICHPGLVNLTIEDRGCLWDVEVVNVVAPQLQNLFIGCCDPMEYMISAPKLSSLAYRGRDPLHLSTDGFHCLKEANIWLVQPGVANAHQLVCLLQQLHNVQFLTLNLEIIELLSSCVELISHQPSLFVNLKSLTVYPKRISEWETRDLPKGKVNLSTEVKNYLLDSSPVAILTMFSREEIIAVKDIPSTRKLMAELRMLLEQEKANTWTKGKAPMESDNAKMHKKRKVPETKMVLQSGGNVTLINSWKDFSLQFEQRIAKACLIISMLESIEGLLKKLPSKNRAMIQPCFSGLCAEADTVIGKITDCMKMQCDENQSRSSVRFHELATSTTMEPFSSKLSKVFCYYPNARASSLFAEVGTVKL